MNEAGKKLKTLHIDSEMGWGGGQRQVSGLCAYLRDQGHQVIIACRAGSELHSWACEESYEVRLVPLKSSLDLLSVLKLRSIILSEQPDVVHLHSSKAHLLGSAAAKLAKAKVVLVTRRMASRVNMGWPNSHAYGSWVDAVVAISGSVRDYLIESGVDAGKIRLIESGTDTERFMKAIPDGKLRDSLGISKDSAVLGAGAKLTELKGLRYLIEAAADLLHEGRNIHVLIAGDGELRDELVSLAGELKVPTSFVGFRSDMPAVLALMDIFVMPSLAEGLGIAALEAMASGKPVVASAVGGLKESIVDGETGFLIPPRDSQAIVEAVRKLLDDNELAMRFGAAGWQRVAEKYSIEGMASRNEELYYELLERTQRTVV